MSGGSFDYLYAIDNEQLLSKIEDIERMKAFLQENGCKKSVKATDEVLSKLKEIRDMDLSQIRKVWHAAEWYRSGDWGKDDLTKANEIFKKGRTL